MSNKEALQHGEQMFLKAGEWERKEKYAKLFVCIFFLLPRCVPLLIMLSVQVYGEK